MSLVTMIVNLANPARSQTLLSVTAPADGTVVNPGQTISVVVSPALGTVLTQVVVVGEDPIGFSAIANTAPFQFLLSIPTDIAVGAYHLNAVGTTGSSPEAHSNYITLDVERSDMPTSLSISPSQMVFDSQGEQFAVRVTATFPDGSFADVTRSSYVSYNSLNASIATAGQNGLITGLASGNTSVAVTYSQSQANVQATVSITVLPPVVSSAPTSLTFGSQTVGSTSAQQQVMLTNNSHTTIQIIGVTATGDFAETDNCASASIFAGGTCMINVTFAPTGVGARSGAVSVTSDFSAVPVGIPLNGVGMAQVVAPPSITNTFGVPSISLNGSTSLTFSVINPNGAARLTSVAFTDTLPSGLIVASPNGLVGSCGEGAIIAVARSAAISLAGAPLSMGASCTFSVNVTGSAIGPQNNYVTVTSTNGGTGNTSNASVTVVPAAPPPPGLTCPAVSSGEVGVPVNSPAITVTGGTPPYTFSVARGTVPPGLTLNTSTGAITGTPTAPGAFSIQATDSTAVVLAGTCAFSFSLTVISNASFLVRYAANLNTGESYIDITNTGANGAPLLGPGYGAASGNICVNVYAFDPSEELISCCSCLVTPDQIVNLGVNRDLTVKTLTDVVPNSVTVKLLSTLAGGDGTGTSCTNSAASVTTATLAGGLAAWGTTLHSPPTGGVYLTTETPFMPSTLSPSELASIGGWCAGILGNGSTFGVCNSCQAGALGATKLPQ